MSITVLVLVGSLRAASVNRRLAELAADVAPDGVRVLVYPDLGALPFYNEDIDTDDPPTAVSDLRTAAAAADAALVVTPEYNGSVPGVLKNAIDWLSRPYGDGALKGKAVAVIGAAQGRHGGVWAHDETRKSLAVAGCRVVDAIRLSLPIGDLAAAHPRDDSQVAAAVRRVVEELADEAGRR